MLDKLKADLLKARRNKDTTVKDVLTTIIGDVQTALKTKADKGKPEEDVCLAKIKKAYEDAKDTVDKYTGEAKIKLAKEIEILKGYMPEKLTEDQMQSIIEQIKPKNIGQAMGHFAKNFKGKVDNTKLRQLVEKYLGDHK